jgi:CTP:molybdopterin cytidylyltransferase MocA
MDGRNEIAAILLAAGGSSRLGRPKQLVVFEGETLIRRAARTLVEGGCSPVIAVLGAEVSGCETELEAMPVDVVINRDWASGMSSSLRVGIERLQESSPGALGALISLCDQPFVTRHDIGRLIEAYFGSDARITAAKYSGQLGVPAIFPKSHFADLMNIQGDRGARGILAMHEAEVVPVGMENARVDIDTDDDLRGDPASQIHRVR